MLHASSKSSEAEHFYLLRRRYDAGSLLG